jgi:transcriptional regulator with XRE-family HTH domain
MQEAFMSFPERLAKIRKERNLGFPELARLTDIHATQLRRYEKGESQPTLDALRKLAISLNVPGDMLLFDEDERKPPEDFLLQFQALMQLEAEDKKAVRSVIDGLLLRHQAKKLMDT